MKLFQSSFLFLTFYFKIFLSTYFTYSLPLFLIFFKHFRIHVNTFESFLI